MTFTDVGRRLSSTVMRGLVPGIEPLRHPDGVAPSHGVGPQAK
jgi:hypothetical protein